ncbi:MAG TPA: complex I subunit 1 family protein [Clostridia bacterium]|nr:complex I subunit 1 family protein [Clostridia bacterium]
MGFELFSVFFSILVFPGLLFLSVFSLFAEFFDRKVYARLQNRQGPPWFQPLADFIKLLGKETIFPDGSDKKMFRLLPVFALAAAVTTILYIPILGINALYAFQGDLIIVMYFLTIPTVTFFLAGWYSKSSYSSIGAVRTLTQLFGYEVPLFMALLGPALLADSWSISDISKFYGEHPLCSLFNIIGFVVAIISVQGKLERVPFDSPDAETEIVAGVFTEYSGKLLAIFRMTIDIEMVVVSALLAAIFIPVFTTILALGILLFIIKTLFVVFILSLIRALFARLRIEQMVRFSWYYLAPLAILQIFIDLVVKGVLLR